jgi:3D (Asp-Asp-Asp) domain-containing protein
MGWKQIIVTGGIAISVILLGDRMYDMYNDLQDTKAHIGVLEKRNKDYEDMLAKLSEQLREKTAQSDTFKVERDIAVKRVHELEREIEKLKQPKKVAAATPKNTSQVISRNNQAKSNDRVMTGFERTWYNYNSGRTSTGTVPKDGRTVAVDPKIIPYGSKLKIELSTGEVMYRVAEDTGSAVKRINGGKVIDVFSTLPTEELLKLGRDTDVTVTILGE